MSEQRANVVAFIEKGLHYFSIGQMEEARVFWNKALELDPNNTQVHEFLQHLGAIPSTRSTDPKTSGALASRISSGQREQRGGEPRWSSWSPGPKEPIHSFADVEEAWLPQEDEPVGIESSPMRAPAPRTGESPGGNRGGEDNPPSYRGGNTPNHAPPPQPPTHPGAGFSSPSRRTPAGSVEAFPTKPGGSRNTAAPPGHPGMYPSTGSYPPVRPPSGSYPPLHPPSGSYPASRPPANPSANPPGNPSGLPHRPPSGVFPSFPPPTKPPTSAPPSAVGKAEESSHPSTPRKPDLSTRFLPSLKSFEVNPNELMDDGSASQPKPTDRWEAPLDAFPEGSQSSFSGSFSGPSRNTNQDLPSQSHLPGQDLSTRYLQTISSQQVSPEDLLEGRTRPKVNPTRTTGTDAHSTLQHTPSAPVAQEYAPAFSIASVSSSSAQDRSTRMLPSLQAQRIGRQSFQELLEDSTLDSKSPLTKTSPIAETRQKPQSPAVHHPESPSVAHISGVSMESDRSTRYLRTVKSEGVNLDYFLPTAFPEGPTEVQPIPFEVEPPSPSLASKDPFPRNKPGVERSTQFFPAVLASPGALLPTDDFADIQLFGEMGPTTNETDGEKTPPSLHIPMQTTGFPVAPEESLSTRLQMNSLQPAPVVFPEKFGPHTQVGAGHTAQAPLQDDLEFLLGGESTDEKHPIPQEDIIDVLSDDSLEVVLLADEATTDSSWQAPPPEGDSTTLQATTVPNTSSNTQLNVPFDVAFGNATTGEFNVTPGPVKVQTGHELATADTGEFEAAPSFPVQVRQRPSSSRAGTGDFAIPAAPVVVERGGKYETSGLSAVAKQALSPVSGFVGSPFEPIRPTYGQHNAFIEPALAETMLPEDAPGLASTDGNTAEHEIGNIFDMPTSIGPATISPPETPGMSGDLSMLLSGIEDLLAEEDFIGAKELLDVAVQQSPNNPKIKILYQLCEKKVAEIYREQFRSLQMVPRLVISLDQLMSLRLNHRDGYILSQIDGITSIADILAISGFEETELFSILGQLIHRNVIVVE